jgi:Holliday junction resolvasome RuvABC endonuclease subunit
MKKIIIGWDISSTTTAYCALSIENNNIEYIDSGYIKPPKKGSIFERLNYTKKEVMLILQKYKPDEIAIEDIIQFMSGASGAKTIIMLTQFNRMIGLACYEYLKSNPELYSVMTIRHGLKLNKLLPKKESMPDLVSKHLGIIFPFEYGKKGAINITSYDKADAIAVALYHSLKLLNKLGSKK